MHKDELVRANAMLESRHATYALAVRSLMAGDAPDLTYAVDDVTIVVFGAARVDGGVVVSSTGEVGTVEDVRSRVRMLDIAQSSDPLRDTLHHLIGEHRLIAGGLPA